MEQAPDVPQRREAQAALDEVERVRAVNEERLRRPGRYWIMTGSFFAVFAIAPLSYDRVPEPYGYLLPPALIPLIAVAFLWRAPSPKLRYRLDDAKISQFVGLGVACVLSAAIAASVYRALELWWVPVSTALVVFIIMALKGRQLDRSWARAASRGE